MEFISVSSSNIRGVNYDRDRQVLTVEFTSGSKYAYKGVGPETYDDFITAPSPGTFFADNVKGIYEYNRVG